MRRRLPAAAFFVAFVAFGVNVECAGAPTTYVATYGSDANGCSLVLPCRSFAVALVQTSTGGEIVVLDSGGYGTVVIDKSVAIVAPDGIYAGVSAFTRVGIAIVSPAALVRLAGLTLSGFSIAETGIEVSTVASVTVERTTFSGFTQAGISLSCCSGEASLQDVTFVTDWGLRASGPWKIVMERSRAVGSGVSVVGGYVAIRDSTFAFGATAVNLMGTVPDPDAAGGSIQGSVLTDNGAWGIAVIGNGPGQPCDVSVSRTLVTRSTRALDLGTGLASGGVVNVDSSVFTDNATGVVLSSDPAQLTLAGTAVVRNQTFGVWNPRGPGAVVESRGNNVIRNNGTDISGPAFVPLSGL